MAGKVLGVKYKIRTGPPPQSDRAKKAHTMAKELGLTSEERYELARMLPGVDKDLGGSWKDLSEEQYHDLLTMLDGFIWLNFIFAQRLK